MIDEQDISHADALGHLAAALDHYDEARPLMARMHTEKAYEAVREAVKNNSENDE